ncbi:hypothetical protein HPB52_019159 [Rhipicephalus sanguineus]|uniref:Endonuclease/exonuclease/phosphatase domain-containing protein n=1 Tax=Rhipicephalus sanguineus TaxID=34632 RepID=A0A9D4PNI9_RHISA|nr:hypothetical protein HPB52_019159 [Rhipicephalus sanguineus]
MGDFNALSYPWGYAREVPKGRTSAEIISTLRLSLLTDSAKPAGVENSVNRDICRDLTLVKNISCATWANLKQRIGSDHYFSRITIPAKIFCKTWGPAKLTDCTAYRSHAIYSVLGAEGYAEWAKQLFAAHSKCLNITKTTEDTLAVDKYLLHHRDARRSLAERWQKNKITRKLKL